MKFKPLDEQVIVITGATSGVGLATARMAAKRGAKLVLVARDEDSLCQLTLEIKVAGGKASYVVANVSDEATVREVGREAMEQFGGFDTWVNNASVGIYGFMEEISSADLHRLFDINFWGVVYGSLEAFRHFRTRGGQYSGVIINLGSAASDRALPIQGMYSVSKHAVKGFTDALRMELEHEGVPVALCLIKPSTIDTPFPQHARNYMEEEPNLPPPLYTPDLVAETILKCAHAPQRDIIVGGIGKFFSIFGQYFPGLGDRMMGPYLFRTQRNPEPAKQRPDSLYQPGFGLEERGESAGPVLEYSPYTKIAGSPILKGVLALGTLMVVAGLIDRSSKKQP